MGDPGGKAWKEGVTLPRIPHDPCPGKDRPLPALPASSQDVRGWTLCIPGTGLSLLCPAGEPRGQGDAAGRSSSPRTPAPAAGGPPVCGTRPPQVSRSTDERACVSLLIFRFIAGLCDRSVAWPAAC